LKIASWKLKIYDFWTFCIEFLLKCGNKLYGLIRFPRGDKFTWCGDIALKKYWRPLIPCCGYFENRDLSGNKLMGGFPYNQTWIMNSINVLKLGRNQLEGIIPYNTFNDNSKLETMWDKFCNIFMYTIYISLCFHSYNPLEMI